MNNFIGRKSELMALQKAYNTPGFQMTVIYGRRRVGKSTLIKQFIKDKQAVYFTATKAGIASNVDRWGKEVISVLAPEMEGMSFTDMGTLLSFLGRKCKKNRVVVVIDEIPYLTEADNSFLSLLQNYIDNEWLNGQMYLIVCGSSISFMEDEVLSSKSPLFGRRTSQIRLKAFSYIEAAEFVPQYSCEDKAICYGITGGIAKYLSLINPHKSLDENIIELFFSKNGYLYEETTNLLTQEFRNINTYNDIIEAIAFGANKVNEISDKAHVDPSVVSHAIKNLLVTEIVEKITAITDENNNKKVQYSIKDGMFRFWYRYVPKALAMIELDKGSEYYYKVVKPNIPEYMGSVFEDMCRYYTLLKGSEEEFGCFITETGKWWGSNPKKREQTDIDVVGIDRTAKKCVLGECKFKNEVIDKGIFEDLQSRNGLIDHSFTTVAFLLFSKAGFSDWITQNAESQMIKYYTLEDIYDNLIP